MSTINTGNGNVIDKELRSYSVMEILSSFTSTRKRMSTSSSWKERRGCCTGKRRSTPLQEDG